METRAGGRSLEIATAVALGVVSLVTALGVLQSSLWSDTASRLGSDAGDARDQGISLAVVAELQQRADAGALLEARLLAQRADAALAAGDFDLAVALETDVGTTIGAAVDLPDDAFAEWRTAGFPEDAIPTQSAEYLVETSGPADALFLASQRLGDLEAAFSERSAIFGQAALVHALALFLFGVAGINRLRTARFVTLAVGALVFLFGLFLMSTAY